MYIEVQDHGWTRLTIGLFIHIIAHSATNMQSYEKPGNALQLYKGLALVKVALDR